MVLASNFIDDYYDHNQWAMHVSEGKDGDQNPWATFTSNVTGTNYFITFLQNVDVVNFLSVFI